MKSTTTIASVLLVLAVSACGGAMTAQQYHQEYGPSEAEFAQILASDCPALAAVVQKNRFNAERDNESPLKKAAQGRIAAAEQAQGKRGC